MHHTTLNPSTVKKLLIEGQSLANVPLIQHALERIQEKRLDVDMVRLAIIEGQLIEYHTDAGTRRILLRHSDGTCVVLDLDVKSIVTAYFNLPDDNHKTLDTSAYLFGATK